MSNYLLHINICMHINYGIDGASKLVNIASKRVNITSVNGSSHKYRIMRPWMRKLLTHPLGRRRHRAVIFVAFFH